MHRQAFGAINMGCSHVDSRSRERGRDKLCWWLWHMHFAHDSGECSLIMKVLIFDQNAHTHTHANIHIYGHKF